jgi:hypothetical protein
MSSKRNYWRPLPADWREAAAKASYLLKLFSQATVGMDPRTHALVAVVLTDFERLTKADSRQSS